MCLVATELFLKTSLFFLEPIQIKTDSKQLISLNHFERNNLELVANRQFLKTQDRNLISQLVSDRNITNNRSILNDTYTISSNNFYDDLYEPQLSIERSIPLMGSTTSWQTKTKFELLALDEFDPQAHFTGGTLWELDNGIGLVDLVIKLNEQIEPIKTTVSWTDTTFALLAVVGNFNPDISFIEGNARWNTDTVLGSLEIGGKFDGDLSLVNGNANWNADTVLGAVAIRGNFDDRTKFTGANATLNAKTTVGSLALKGNFDRNVNFRGGNIKVTTDTLIGFFNADIKIDREIEFKGANTSWNTNLLFGTDFGVSGSFDETKSFTCFLSLLQNFLELS